MTMETKKKDGGKTAKPDAVPIIQMGFGQEETLVYDDATDQPTNQSEQENK